MHCITASTLFIHIEFRIDVPHDQDIQAQPLEIKVWDKDFYSPDDAIGILLLDLSSLLLKAASSSIEGWFPLFDTLEGIRGELYLTVSVSHFGVVESSLASPYVQFFHTSNHLHGYNIDQVISFAEVIVCRLDPEYHWKDTFRASRTTNEQRQLLFSSLTLEARQQLATKCVQLGGNSIVGLIQELDLEC